MKVLISCLVLAGFSCSTLKSFKIEDLEPKEYGPNDLRVCRQVAEDKLECVSIGTVLESILAGPPKSKDRSDM